MKVFLLALLALGAVPPGEGLRRFEYLEDFEEPPARGTIYNGWERVSSPNHPAWNRIERVQDPEGARSGECYLRLTTQGGATAFQMQKKVAWAIDPARSYRLSALVRLTATQRNTATITISWLNRRFETLDEATSPPASGDGGWREVTVDLPTVPEGTVWAIVRLSFAGPDVRGECCFDRLMLTRPPRLSILPADRTLPIFDPTRPPRLNIVARELPEGHHEADVRLRAGDGRERVLRRGLPVRDAAVVPVELPLLDPGMYTVIVSLSGPDRVPTDRECPVLVAGRPWLAHPRQSNLFGGSFDPFVRDYPDARGLAELAGFQRTRVTLWHRPAPGDRRPPDPAQIFEFVRRLSEVEWMTVIGLIDRPPPEDFPDVDPATLEKGTAALLEVDRRTWEPQLKAATLRYREFIPLWQAGTSLVPTAELLRTFDGEPIVQIEAGPPEEFLRRLVLHASATPAPRPAFVPVDRLLDADGFPGAGFLALRAANDILPGATPRPDLLALLGPPVRAAFVKDGRAILVFWTDSGEVEREFNLGPEAEIFPPLESPRRILPGERVRIGTMPLFIGKVNPSFLETQLSLRLVDPADPAGPGNSLPLRTSPIYRTLRFRNRSRQSEIANLRVRILEPLPPEWTIRPLEARDLSIPPNKELTHDLTLTLPPTEEEGERPLTVELLYTQDGRPQSVREKLLIKVMPQIVIDIQVADIPGGDDARKVSIRMTNATNRKMTLVAAVRLPDRPEQTEPLGTLEPNSPVERPLDYIVRNLSAIDKGHLRVEVLIEESGGERLHARKTAPLR
jgi:hypothetical protein